MFKLRFKWTKRIEWILWARWTTRSGGIGPIRDWRPAGGIAGRPRRSRSRQSRSRQSRFIGRDRWQYRFGQ